MRIERRSCGGAYTVATAPYPRRQRSNRRRAAGTGVVSGPDPAERFVHGSRQDARSRRRSRSGRASCGRTPGIYRFDPDAPGEIFSIDTPPPYVSAAHLHVGHAMSYSQAEFIVRYQRMRGRNVFYPMGFDDNGLPTERYVEQKYDINKARTTRSEFRALCLKETRRDRGRLRTLLAQARPVGRLAPAVLDDRRPLPAHRAAVVPRPARQGPRLPVRGAGVLGPVDADVARAGRSRDDHAQLDVARHRVPRARRPRPRDLDDAPRADPELRRAVLQSRATSGTQSLAGQHAIVPITGHEVPILSDDDVQPRLRHRPDDGLHLRRRRRRAALEARRPRPAAWASTPAGKLTDVAGAYAGLDIDAARKRIVADLEAAGALRGSQKIEQQVVGVRAHAAAGRVPDAAALVRPRARPHRRAARAQRRARPGTPTT